MLTPPLKTLLMSLNISLTEPSADTLIALLVFMASFFRACFFVFDPSFSKKEEITGILVFCIIAIIWSIHYLNMNALGTAFSHKAIFAAFLLPAFLYAELTLLGGKDPELSKLLRFFYLQIFTVVLSVGVMAAIKRGCWGKGDATALSRLPLIKPLPRRPPNL